MLVHLQRLTISVHFFYPYQVIGKVLNEYVLHHLRNGLKTHLKVPYTYLWYHMEISRLNLKNVPLYLSVDAIGQMES